MPTDIKLPKTQISKIIQSGVFLGAMLSKISGPFIKIAVSLAKNIRNNTSSISNRHKNSK